MASGLLEVRWYRKDVPLNVLGGARRGTAHTFWSVDGFRPLAVLRHCINTRGVDVQETMLDPAFAETAGLARRASELAAADAGVRIIALEAVEEVRRIAFVIQEVWGKHQIVRDDMLRALAHAGGVLLAAEPCNPTAQVGGRDDSIYGYALGFLGWNRGAHLHSHQVAVSPRVQGRGVGYALKLAQRAECLEHGVDEIRWTFDPLLMRNARFNLTRLGARVIGFLPNCYGRMGDAINGDDLSDRFEVSWQLGRDERPTIIAGDPLLTVDAEGFPRRTGARVAPGATVAIPPDYHRLRIVRDPRASAWRATTRAIFAECFASGLAIEALGSTGYQFQAQGTSA
jgi:predicted GNAT superfamily acetyltransferase